MSVFNHFYADTLFGTKPISHFQSKKKKKVKSLTVDFLNDANISRMSQSHIQTDKSIYRLTNL